MNTDKIKIKVKKLNKNAVIPTKINETDVGYDIRSIEHVILKPFEVKLIKTGLAFEIPPEYYIDVNPRSGLAVKQGIHVLAGIIDPGYRNELGIVLSTFKAAEYFYDNLNSLLKGNRNMLLPQNTQAGVIEINPGDRIAQLIIKPRLDAEFIEVEELDNSERGMKGFGDSGVK